MRILKNVISPVMFFYCFTFLLLVIVIIQRWQIEDLEEALNNSKVANQSYFSRLNELEKELDAKEPNPAYDTYGTFEPPNYPGYTLDWKLLVSEENNFLFLYPNDLSISKNSGAKYAAIELSGISNERYVYARRLDNLEITSHEKRLEFDSLIGKINEQAAVSIESGYSVFPNPLLSSSSDIIYFLEVDTETNMSYNSVLITNPGWPEVTLLRTRGLNETEVEEVIGSFKYLR
ncbi:hypothetical protein C4561_03005 [candidate division WWE3 bacterium]|jgi:hypothetical protein|uniref:Uncharacterized protein n=1 Tax=candidate division WWE3 bacterium TaxID=2053526 RepID=A0A3A4ZKA0_UNCKA|nr:MAG: hypothetical protein C4561_03005 [candidate division WWE3 bacterium]